MAKCDFCGDAIAKGMGKMFVKKDGKILNFCSNKCEKNMFKLRRKSRTMGWTEEYKKDKTMRMAAAEHEKKDAKPAKKEVKK